MDGEWDGGRVKVLIRKEEVKMREAQGQQRDLRDLRARSWGQAGYKALTL